MKRFYGKTFILNQVPFQLLKRICHKELMVIAPGYYVFGCYFNDKKKVCR